MGNRQKKKNIKKTMNSLSGHIHDSVYSFDRSHIESVDRLHACLPD